MHGRFKNSYRCGYGYSSGSKSYKAAVAVTSAVQKQLGGVGATTDSVLNYYCSVGESAVAI